MGTRVSSSAWRRVETGKEGRDGDVNLGGALGVLITAKDENSRGLAVEYHLPAPASAFAGILDEADYLM
jgi:hypothetical protein